MMIPVTFHRASVEKTTEGYTASIFVKTEEGQAITLYKDIFYDPLSAMQTLLKVLGDLQ